MVERGSRGTLGETGLRIGAGSLCVFLPGDYGRDVHRISPGPHRRPRHQRNSLTKGWRYLTTTALANMLGG